MVAGGKCVKASGCVSRGIFGDNCVRMAKERLWSQGENASKASELGNLIFAPTWGIYFSYCLQNFFNIATISFTAYARDNSKKN